MIISVVGFIGMVFSILKLTFFYVSNKAKMVIGILLVIISLVTLGWFIYGSVIVFKNWEPYYNHFWTDYYCNKTVYLFAFSMLIITYIAIACTCCSDVLKRCIHKKPRNESYAWINFPDKK